MALNADKLKAVELIFKGNKPFGKIAQEVGVSEKTLYNWRQSKEFDDAIISMANQTIKDVAGLLTENMTEIAFNGKSEFARLQATQYLLDKSGIGETDELNINVKPVEIIDDIIGKSE